MLIRTVAVVSIAGMGLCVASASAQISAAGVQDAKDTALAPEHDPFWMTKMDEAMRRASAEDKLLFIDFTGSDWCIWCKRLSDEVMSHDEFRSAVPKQFVMVELDFPKGVPQSEEVKAHNAKWAELYEIESFPTIVLADANGEAFAQTGYRPGGPTEYVPHLEALIDAREVVAATLAKAERAEGVERAQLLDTALTMENMIVPDRDAHIDEIIAIDADGAAGLRDHYVELRDQYAEQRAARLINKRLMTVQELFMGGKVDEAIAEVKGVMSELKPTGQAYLSACGMLVMLQLEQGYFDDVLPVLVEMLGREDVPAEFKPQILNAGANMLIDGDRKDLATRLLDAGETMELGPQVEQVITGLRQHLAAGEG